MAKKATRQVSIFINGKEVENTFNGIENAQRRVRNELRKLTIGSEEYVAKASELKRLNGMIDEHRSALTGTQKGWSLMNSGLGSFVGLAAGAFAADTVIQYGTELFKTGVQLQALDRKAKTVFGDTLPQVTAEAERNAEAMGLTTREYVSAAAAMQDLLVPLGFTRKEAAGVSTQLTNLSGALAEWTGGQYDAKQVADILSSALLGEREQLKALGIDLQQSDIDAEIAARGLKGLTGEAEKQAEALVTLDLIMRKSVDAQTAFATGQDGMIRKSAELSANWKELKETVSEALIPVFNRLLQIANDTFDVFGKAAKSDFSGSLRSAFDAYKNFDPTLMILTQTGIIGGDTPQAAAAPAAPATDPNEAKRIQDEQNARLLETQKAQAAAAAKEKARQKAEQAAQEKREQAQEEAQERANDQREAEADAQAWAKRYNAAKGGLDRINQLAADNRLQQTTFDAQAAQDEVDRIAEKERMKVQTELDFQTEKAAAEEQVRLATLTDHQLELEELEAHYQRLLMVADTYGVNTAELTRKHNEEKAAIEKEFQDKKAADEAKMREAQYVALANEFSALGEITVGLFDAIGAETEDAAALQKVAALAKIAFDTASAISSLVAASNANPTNAVTFGGAGIAQYATGIVRILANIAQAKKVLKSAPEVTQKFMGGPLAVTGATDKRRYTPNFTSTPTTGLLPPGPQMFTSSATGAPVLANERGREYFVSAEDMRDPYVANLTRMIEVATRGGNRSVSQFAEGGSNPPTASADPAGFNMGALAATLAQLNATLASLQARGIPAVIGDATLVQGQKQLERLNKVSGGYFPS